MEHIYCTFYTNRNCSLSLYYKMISDPVKRDKNTDRGGGWYKSKIEGKETWTYWKKYSLPLHPPPPFYLLIFVFDKLYCSTQLYYILKKLLILHSFFCENELYTREFLNLKNKNINLYKRNTRFSLSWENEKVF